MQESWTSKTFLYSLIGMDLIFYFRMRTLAFSCYFSHTHPADWTSEWLGLASFSAATLLTQQPWARLQRQQQTSQSHVAWDTKRFQISRNQVGCGSHPGVPYFGWRWEAMRTPLSQRRRQRWWGRLHTCLLMVLNLLGSISPFHLHVHIPQVFCGEKTLSALEELAVLGCQMWNRAVSFMCIP